MKHMIKNIFSSSLVAFSLLVAFTSCDDDKDDYDNKAFVNSSQLGTIIIKGVNDEERVAIRTAVAKPAAFDIKVSYKADVSLVSKYNLIYSDNAVKLPAENYEIANNTSIIEAGAIQGNDVEILFKGLSEIDRDLVYVLPVMMADANFDFLESTRTSYFVIKGGALINTVGDITKNHLKLESSGTSTLKNMSQVTVEALVYVDEFGKLISTLMGIEGSFLFRVGDAGVPDNQMQLATSSGNITDAAWKIPTNEWVHIAVTFDSSNGEVEFYLNGIKKGDTKTSSYRRAVNWASDNFYIGKSYDDNRYLAGRVSEVRVWNRVLTADEINAKEHFYMVPADSEGLAAYWKFDEGAGQAIADHTGNGNNLLADKNITWITVSLPK